MENAPSSIPSYTPVAHQKSVRYRPYLLATILVALTTTTLYLLPSDPAIASRMAELQNRWFGQRTKSLNDIIDPVKVEQNDPQLDTTLPQNETGQAIRKAALVGKKAYLVVFLGTCTGCIKLDFITWQKMARQRGMQLIGLSQGTPTQIHDMQMQLHNLNVQMPILSDEKAEVYPRINAYYSGRAYLYSPAWRLKWMGHTFNSANTIWEDRAFTEAYMEAQTQP